MSKPRTVGRPRGRRTASLTVTLTADEYQDLQIQARHRGMTLANLARERLGATLARYDPTRGNKRCATIVRRQRKLPNEK